MITLRVYALAAGLSVRSIFKTQHYKRQNQISAFVQKLKWADGSGSDLIAILNAYKVSLFIHEFLLF